MAAPPAARSTPPTKNKPLTALVNPAATSRFVVAGFPSPVTAGVAGKFTVAAQDAFGFRYASDTRGEAPFRPEIAAGVLSTLQVPTTMPTMDELLGRVTDLPGTLARAVRPGINVFTLHAEVEGGRLLTAFEAFIAGLGRTGVSFVRLDAVAAQALAAGDELPVAPVVRRLVDGRSGWVAAQAHARSRQIVAPR